MVQIGEDDRWVKISGDPWNTTLGLKSDGTLWYRRSGGVSTGGRRQRISCILSNSKGLSWHLKVGVGVGTVTRLTVTRPVIGTNFYEPVIVNRLTGETRLPNNRNRFFVLYCNRSTEITRLPAITRLPTIFQNPRLLSDLRLLGSRITWSAVAYILGEPRLSRTSEHEQPPIQAILGQSGRLAVAADADAAVLWSANSA